MQNGLETALGKLISNPGIIYKFLQNTMSLNTKAIVMSFISEVLSIFNMDYPLQRRNYYPVKVMAILDLGSVWNSKRYKWSAFEIIYSNKAVFLDF